GKGHGFEAAVSGPGACSETGMLSMSCRLVMPETRSHIGLESLPRRAHTGWQYETVEARRWARLAAAARGTASTAGAREYRRRSSSSRASSNPAKGGLAKIAPRRVAGVKPLPGAEFEIWRRESPDPFCPLPAGEENPVKR